MDLVNIMKKAASEAQEESKPVNIVQGTVTSVSPLVVKIDQKLILDASYLILSRNVTDYTAQVGVSWKTDSGGEPQHNHGLTGKKSITVYNALKIGEKVVMARVQGGQKYLVLDRIG